MLNHRQHLMRKSPTIEDDTVPQFRLYLLTDAEKHTRLSIKISETDVTVVPSTILGVQKIVTTPKIVPCPTIALDEDLEGSDNDDDDDGDDEDDDDDDEGDAIEESRAEPTSPRHSDVLDSDDELPFLSESVRDKVPDLEFNFAMSNCEFFFPADAKDVATRALLMKSHFLMKLSNQYVACV